MGQERFADGSSSGSLSGFAGGAGARRPRRSSDAGGARAGFRRLANSTGLVTNPVEPKTVRRRAVEIYKRNKSRLYRYGAGAHSQGSADSSSRTSASAGPISSISCRAAASSST